MWCFVKLNSCRCCTYFYILDGYSDIPDDRSSVLLLGVTRIPTTPTAARRPSSLPLGTTPFFPHNNPIAQHKSRKNYPSRRNTLTRQHSLKQRDNNFIPGTSQKDIAKNKRELRSRSSTLSSSESNSTSSDQKCFVNSNDVTPTNSFTNSSEFTSGPTMDRSVDSIGACSLDADVSADVTDWSEQSSVGTLRSLSITTPEPQPYLPSYLSLACTVSGYSTTTNYDPERLSKSRDASPNRRQDDLNPVYPNKSTTYHIRNNLLSPPNLVPLPHHKYSPLTPESLKTKDMEDQIERREVYTSSMISSSYSQEIKHYTSSVVCKDVVDGCVKNGHDVQSRCISFESKSMSNGSTKVISDTYKEYGNGLQQKSFIQQRVERLYGPGALAQGFFISKRQKNKSESEFDRNMLRSPNDKHSKSMSDKLLEDCNENNLKQSTSSPTLPVLRHLRPEFRAQLPIIHQKKINDIILPKSQTIPILHEENKLNGHSIDILKSNGDESSIKQDDDDGHYFLRILEKESNRLLLMADKIEKDLESNGLNEDIKGKLRSASGKARLLTSQKMQQFRGLCTNNLTQKAGEAFPTTNEDLQGFWDMVLLQVDQVDELFREIDKLRANNWIETETEKKISNGSINKTRKNVRLPRPGNTTSSEASKEREAKRKQLIEERRKAMRQHKQNAKENIEIFVPESS
ncbi:hypothetical protein FQR65_LT06828 [Abscondita terminalis]|nr:hypothetical protein FQR65_LT06828 [Abscondita terminalis]